MSGEKERPVHNHSQQISDGQTGSRLEPFTLRLVACARSETGQLLARLLQLGQAPGAVRFFEAGGVRLVEFDAGGK